MYWEATAISGVPKPIKIKPINMAFLICLLLTNKDFGPLVISITRKSNSPAVIKRKPDPVYGSISSTINAIPTYVDAHTK
jgi:hypothetical protein